jgi:hypothetical protein
VIIFSTRTTFPKRVQKEPLNRIPVRLLSNFPIKFKKCSNPPLYNKTLLSKTNSRLLAFLRKESLSLAEIVYSTLEQSQPETPISHFLEQRQLKTPVSHYSAYLQTLISHFSAYL